MQKRTARISTPGALTMSELNWILFFIETYMKKYIRDQREQLQITLIFYIKNNSGIHNRSTRFLNSNFHCPVHYKNTAGRTFSVSVSTIRNWNELYADVKKVKNVKSFKKKLYTDLVITKQRETGNLKYVSNTVVKQPFISSL